MKNTSPLTVPLSGVGRLSLVDDKRVTKQLGIACAAWQNLTPKTPVRVTIRVDGLTDKNRSNAAMFPCAVMRVDYTQGGLQRSILVDCLDQQSSLVVWADSVECTPVWDDRRIARIAGEYAPKPENTLTAAISAGEQGDFGSSDARWLDAIFADVPGSMGGTETSVHPIPDGARGMRFLNTLVSGANYSVPDHASFILWAVNQITDSNVGIVQVNIDGETDTSIVIVPPLAKYLFLVFPTGTIASFDTTSWIEWIYAPNTLPGF